MSKNFEILQSLQDEAEVFSVGPSNRVGRNPNLQIPDARVREQITRLVQRIYLMGPKSGTEGRSVLFAGIDSGSGSASICALCGQMLASQVTGTVCIVDASDDVPSVRNALGLKSQIAAVISGGSRFEHNTLRIADSNLFFTTAAAISTRDGKSLNTEELNRALTELRAQFDYLVLHGSPLASSSDTFLIGKVTDGVVMVIDAHVTRRAPTLQVKSQLDSAGVPILGAVLNGRTFPIPASIYKRL